MKQMIQFKDDIKLGRTGAVKRTLRRALSLALMTRLAAIAPGKMRPSTSTHSISSTKRMMMP